MNCKRKNHHNVSKELSVKLQCKRSELLPDSLKESIGDINRSWVCDEPLDADGIHIRTWPFKHCIVKNFVQDTKYLRELRKELLDLEYETKDNDLYQFHQSHDLMSIDKPYINRMKIFLEEECRAWLGSATGIVLNHKISSTSSSYTFTDHLLCHDDKCEDRRIAFILYLSENWLSEFGGLLELFSTDDQGEPDKIVSAIEPVFNSFVFFEVTCKSFHQVSEVRTTDRTRLSVNGWFHGTLPDNEPTIENLPLEKCFVSPQCVKNGIMSYVNAMYLKPDIQEQINTSFEQDSEILLPDFFDVNFYDELCKCLRSDDLSWMLQGPANRRKYETLQEENLPYPVEQVLQLFKSEQFFQLLSNFTQLELKPDVSENAAQVPQCSYQVERWKSGFYTLLHDAEYHDESALDVVLFCNVKQSKQLQGGFMSYVVDNEEEVLLTLFPSNNALSLTFRDKETNRFIKYINNLFDSCFHIVSFTYYEKDTKA